MKKYIYNIQTDEAVEIENPDAPYLDTPYTNAEMAVLQYPEKDSRRQAILIVDEGFENVPTEFRKVIFPPPPATQNLEPFGTWREYAAFWRLGQVTEMSEEEKTARIQAVEQAVAQEIKNRKRAYLNSKKAFLLELTEEFAIENDDSGQTVEQSIMMANLMSRFPSYLATGAVDAVREEIDKLPEAAMSIERKTGILGIIDYWLAANPKP